jgi:hypothetical protein
MTSRLEDDHLRRRKSMRPEQTVAEMAEEVLVRQAKAMLAHTGQSFESALETVSSTEAGQQLRELTNGEHRDEKAQDWQMSVLSERAEGRLMHLIASETVSRFVAERHYSWVENYMEWLEGKEARPEHHALLEEELSSLRG